MKHPDFSCYEESARYLSGRLPKLPSLAVILGSGLGAYAASDRVKNKTTIPYREIPHFPVSTVSYQKGELTVGEVGDRTVMFFNGRFHYYEGWEMWQTAYPVVMAKLLGVKGLVITNAAGGINADKVSPGDLVLLCDHIKLSPDSPVRGENFPQLGERFFDMQSVYDKTYRQTAKDCAAKLGISLKEGVYGYMAGPQFETAAEIRALRLLGADVVGMSTVAEVIEAAHCHLPVLGISCVSNLAAGVTGAPMTEEEVLETTSQVSRKFTALLEDVLLTLPVSN